VSRRIRTARLAQNRASTVILAAGGAAIASLALPASTVAVEAGAGLTQTGKGTVVVSCETPNPVGVEVAPTASSAGIAVPAVTTPAINVPGVTIGQVQVGPATVGPLTVGGFTVPPQTFGGVTIGSTSASDEVAGVAGVECGAVNVTSPATPTVISGLAVLQLFIEELNTNTNSVVFVPYLPSTSRSLTAIPAASGVDLATAVLTDTHFGVPAAGQLDPATGMVSLGIAQYYFGVQVSVNGVAEPTGIGCQPGHFSCSSSGTFPVF
jgi:hypothetical protein